MSFLIKNTELQLKNINNLFENLNIQAQNIIGIHNLGEQMQNIALQMLNLGIKLFNKSFMFPDLQTNIYNIKFQIENANLQINNIISHLNIKIQNFENCNLGNNFMMMNNSNENTNKKINVTFKTIHGLKVNLVVDYGKSMKEVLEKFCERIGKPELIRDNKIYFLCNSEKININDQTKVEDFQNKVFLYFHSHIIVNY